MENRPDPALFARGSFYMGIASSAILLLSFILGMLRVGLSSIVWLALVTSAVGLFLGWASRSDFKKNPGTPEVMQMADTGWRINLWALIVLVVVMLLVVILRVVVAIGPTIQG